MSGGTKRQFVANRTHASDRAQGDIGKIRVMTECLARVHVAQVHFDEGDLHRKQRIAKCDAGVRERGRIEDDESYCDPGASCMRLMSSASALLWNADR